MKISGDKSTTITTTTTTTTTKTTTTTTCNNNNSNKNSNCCSVTGFVFISLIGICSHSISMYFIVSSPTCTYSSKGQKTGLREASFEVSKNASQTASTTDLKMFNQGAFAELVPPKTGGI